MQEINFRVARVKKRTADIVEIKLDALSQLPEMRAGQFVHVSVDSAAMLLRRPFCLYKWDKKSISILVAVVGRGTECLSRLKKKDLVTGTLPLGNGFYLEPHQKTVALIGGGVGVAPLLQVPRSCFGRKPNTIVMAGAGVIVPIINTVKGTEVRAYLGFGNKNKIVAKSEFSEVVEKLVVATDDGSRGFKGNAVEAFLKDYNDPKKPFRPDVILTCGPDGLIRGVKKMAQELNIPALMSGEIHMGCGVGACLVCACAVKDSMGNIQNQRACVEGPVFRLEELV